MHESRTLEEAVEIYQALRLCCTEAVESARRNGWEKFANKLAERMGKSPEAAAYDKKYLQDLLDKRVIPILDEMCFIDLVRVFERMIFDFVDNASGEIRKTIRASRGSYPFYSCAEKFVKSSAQKDINNLGHVQEIVQGKLSPDLCEKLRHIVKCRNWLAHGNRFKDQKDQPSRPADMEEALEILQDLLARIRPMP